MNTMILKLLTAFAVAVTVLLSGCISAKPQVEEAVAATPAPEPEPAPPADSDGDGVPDGDDRCPGTRAGVEVDATGCEIILSLRGALFDFDKSNLRPDAVAALEEVLPLLAKHKTKRIEVAGHTDSIGTDTYNEGLGARRASAVTDYLIEHGIDASRLRIQSYGESRPIADNDTEDGRQQNRRVELVDLGSD